MASNFSSALSVRVCSLLLPADQTVAVEHVGAVGLGIVAEGVLAHQEAESGVLVHAGDELIPVQGLVVHGQAAADALCDAEDLVVDDELQGADGLGGLQLAGAAQDGGLALAWRR